MSLEPRHSKSAKVGDLVEVIEVSTIRHGIVVSNREGAFPDAITLYVPARARPDREARNGVEPWFPDPKTVRCRQARGPWDDTLLRAFDVDPWDLRPYDGSPRQARARVARDA